MRELNGFDGMCISALSRLKPGLLACGVYRCPLIVYYFARPELVQIVRVLHSAREIDNIEFMSDA